MCWPNVRDPTNKHRAAFRKCLRLTYCPNAPATSRSCDYQLHFKMGTWYVVHRHIEFEAYRAKKCLYYRSELGLHPALPTSLRGFYDIQADTVSAPPLKSNPISPNFSAAGTLWTRRPRLLLRQWMPRSRRIVHKDEIHGLTALHLTIVSDAAVHVAAQKGAINWHIVDDDGRICSASMPLEVHRDSYSYRHELHGIYEGLVDTLSSHPEVESVTCHCDNEAGIDKINHQVVSPGELLGPDMDIVWPSNGWSAVHRVRSLSSTSKGMWTENALAHNGLGLRQFKLPVMKQPKLVLKWDSPLTLSVPSLERGVCYECKTDGSPKKLRLPYLLFPHLRS
jgi:hypothetical protein